MTATALEGIKSLRTPFTSESARQIFGLLHQIKHQQLTAASASAQLMGIATHAGKVNNLFYVIQEEFASGESMTLDVLRNGTSILQGGAVTLDDTTDVGARVGLPLLDGMADIAIGDFITVTRVYTAGGTPAAPANGVFMEWCPD